MASEIILPPFEILEQNQVIAIVIRNKKRDLKDNHSYIKNYSIIKWSTICPSINST